MALSTPPKPAGARNTILVSPTGSLIALKHRVFLADTIRIINLENMEEVHNPVRN